MAGGGNLSEAPNSVDGFHEVLVSHQKVRVVGTGTQLKWLPDFGGDTVSVRNWTGIEEFRPDDLIVKVRAGTLVRDLLAEVRASGLTVPLADLEEFGEVGCSGTTVGGWLSLGMPHLHQGSFGPVRDWVTGMTVMLSTGEVVKLGSTVVKSVAGYDLHRTMVGARGSLGLILDVTLRLQPFARVGQPEVFFEQGDYQFVSRVPLAEFEEVANSFEGPVAADCKSGLVWSNGRSSDGRVVWTLGRGGLIHPGPVESVRVVERKLKEKFDPRGLFARGFSYE